MFLYFQEMELSGSSMKKFFMFSQKKSALIFQETKTPKKFLIFSLKKSFSYISGNGNSEKIPYVSGNETFLYFRK